MMWSFNPSVPALGILALAFPLLSTAKPYPVQNPDLEFNPLVNSTQLAERGSCASGNTCGYYAQLCCDVGQSCYTDANNQAQCGGPVTAQATGAWVYYTTTWVETGLVTRTSIYSSYVGGATAQATQTAACYGAQSPCGGICCDSGYYCLTSGQCALIGGGSSGGVTGTLAPSAPLRPTSSTLIVVTATGSPTTTVPFETPIATGVNATITSSNQSSGGGLSGGAIAGIVIGVLAGILLLTLLCLFCCARALFDTVLGIFGLGKRRRHTHEETYIEEHHHSSGGGGGRRWYGQGPARPSRPPRKESGGMGNALGIGALLGGLAIALGLKRRHDRRHDEKSTTASSYSYSDYTTSASSESSDDRRTRRSSRR